MRRSCCATATWIWPSRHGDEARGARPGGPVGRGDGPGLRQVVTLHRLGKVAQRLATANVQRIGAGQERPRLTYILGEYSGMGTPVFLTSGACLGINVTRILRGNGPNGMGVHDEYDMNMASVVIPGADILEIAKQAPAYKTD